MMLFLQWELKAVFGKDFEKQAEKRSAVDLSVSFSTNANIAACSSLVHTSSSVGSNGKDCGVFLPCFVIPKTCKDFWWNPKRVMLF